MSKTSYSGGGSGGGGGPPSGAAGGQLGGTYPNPTVVGITETSGPTALAFGSIADLSVLMRSGAAIVGIALASLVPSSRTINTTAPLAGGGDLSANRTLTVAAVSNVSSGVVPQTNGTAGQALIATSTGSTWSNNFQAQSLVTTGNLSLGTTPAGTGIIRIPNAQTVFSKTSAAVDSALIGIDGSDNLNVGNSSTAVSTWIRSGGNIHFDLSGNEILTLTATNIGPGVSNIGFTASVVTPTIFQGDDVNNTVTGDLFTVHAQDCSGTTTVTAGGLTVRAGNATGGSGSRTGGNASFGSGSGATANGSLALQVGATTVFSAAADTTTVTVGNTTGGSINITSAGGSIRTNGANRILWSGGTVTIAVAGLDFGVGGDSNISIASTAILGFDRATGSIRNLSLHADGTQNFQSGDKIIYIIDRVAVPTGNPSGGGYHWMDTGGLPSWRNVAGDILIMTLTTAATATAGGGAITPATVSEFMTINYKGNVRKIALYAN